MSAQMPGPTQELPPKSAESPAQSTTLAALKAGQMGEILRVGGPRLFRRRLLELGLVPGTDVRLVNVAPLGDPLELEVRGCRLSIRRNEAAVIEVALHMPPRKLQVLP